MRREPVGTKPIWTGAGTKLSSQIFFPGDGDVPASPPSSGFGALFFFFPLRSNQLHRFPANFPSFTDTPVQFTQRAYAICTEYVQQRYLRFKFNEKTKAANETVGLGPQGLPI